MKKMLVLLLSLTLVLFSCENNIKNNVEDKIDNTVNVVELSQVNNSSKLKVDITTDSRIKEYSLQVFSSYDNEEIEIASCSGKLSGGHVAEVIETNGYGKLKVRITFPNANYSVERDINIVSDEYTFVLLPATLPVTVFTLENISSESDVPTFLGLERSLSYNWDNLPSNMYRNPKIPKEINDNSNLTFHTHQVPRMIELVKELHEISPDAKINFVTSDIYPELIVKTMLWNGISDANITIYSDGTATYSLMQGTFGGDSEAVQAKYDELKADWESIKNDALSGDKTCLDKYEEKWSKYATLKIYSPIIAQDENVTWKVGRKGLLTCNNETIQSLIQGAAEQFNLGSLLTSLDEEKQNSLKALYNFDTGVFDESRKNNKKIMVFLGTRNDYSNGHLEDYLSFLKTYYGEDYDYYYKGHPAEPSGLPQFDQKKQIFDSVGCGEVDASIPAEIILFFCPDIDLCGYPSTTYQSADSSHVFTIMGTNDTTIDSLKTTCNNNGYLDKVNSFIAKIDETTYSFEVVGDDCYIWDSVNKKLSKQ